MPKVTENQTTKTPVVFRDKAFKVRTVVLPDGRSFPVEKSRIESDDEALTAFLDKHPDFERQTAAVG